MILLALAELIAFALVVVLGLTQIVLPLILGRPIFPLFRRRKLSKQLKQAWEDVEQDQLREEIDNVRNLRQPRGESRESKQV